MFSLWVSDQGKYFNHAVPNNLPQQVFLYMDAASMDRIAPVVLRD
jgi:hypothetical protein